MGRAAACSGSRAPEPGDQVRVTLERADAAAERASALRVEEVGLFASEAGLAHGRPRFLRERPGSPALQRHPRPRLPRGWRCSGTLARLRHAARPDRPGPRAAFVVRS